jgi:ABC-type nitrate/sulfonate/bicarbonate transport system substrate-binding protein
MTQVYFHCASARRALLDQNGAEVADLVEAHERATGIARELIATPGAEDWRDWTMHINDEFGEEIFALSFSSLLGKLH